MRVALVHDWLTVPGGSEVVLDALLDIYPDAPVHTLLYERATFRDLPVASRRIRTSFLNRLPGARRHHRAFVGLFPSAVEQFDLRGYDVVISNSCAVGHGVITTPDQVHVAYVNRNMQYAWESYHQDLRSFGVSTGLRGLVARSVYHYLRLWDQLAFQRPDVVIANSEYMRRRIAKHYRRDARVIHPPVALPTLTPPRDRGEEYLFVGRLVPVKRVEMLVEAFNALDLPLRIIGDGPEGDHLRRIAGANVEFCGWQPRPQVIEAMARARALVLPSDEAFGIAAVEAQSVGAPVIGYARSGVSEAVIDGETGLLYEDQSKDGLIEAIQRFEAIGAGFDAAAMRRHASNFSVERFKEQMQRAVDEAWQGSRSPRGAISRPA